MPIDVLKPVILLPQERGSTVGAFRRVAEEAGIPTVVRKPLPESIFPENNYPLEGLRDIYIVWVRGERDTRALALAEKASEKGARVGVVALVSGMKLENRIRKLGVDNLSPDEMNFSSVMDWLKNLRDVKSYLRRVHSDPANFGVSPFPWNNR